MKIKLISVVVIILTGLLTIGILISSSMAITNEYNGYLASARANAEKNIPYTACQKYRQAFNIKCEDESIYREYLEQCKLLGDSFYSSAVKDYVNKFPESSTAYEELCKYYYESESYRNVITTASKAREVGVATEKVKDYYLECFYMYKYIKTGLEEASTFLGNYALIKDEGLYGYLRNTGGYLIRPMYEQVSIFMGANAAVYDGTEWYMINESGYKVAAPTEKIDTMSFLSNGKIRVSKNGKYGYTNPSFTIAETLPYDNASNFKNQVAAVQKDGKWALINADEENITDYIFDDVLLDEYGTCINGGVIFVKKDDKYYMVNAEGKKVSDQGFDDAYPFVSSEPAAICIDGKWGFVNTEGNIVIEPQYTDAKSFSNGLAGVANNGMWGYINTDNIYRINQQFTDCNPFSNGIAAVQENGVWNYIKLLAYFN